MTLNLNTGEYTPCIKPKNLLQFVNIISNIPTAVLRNIPEGVNERLLEISSNEEVFNKAIPPYQKALDESGHRYNLHYQPGPQRTKRKPRRRNIIWYNPPYDQNVKTNLSKEFLKIIKKCFPPSRKLHKIFNKNTIKTSYSFMPNLGAIIEGNNKKKMQIEESKSVGKQCSFPRSTKCPLQGKCLSRDIIYQATVKCEDNEEIYVGLTVTDFRSRLANHKASFKTKSKQNASELRPLLP